MPVELTPAMRGVLAYFEELGPRWGLQPKSCAVHALLYLVGTPLGSDEIADTLELERSFAKAAISDLVEWQVVKMAPDGRVWADGEPWDLLFAGMEERRRREIGPALHAIIAASQQAIDDGTPRATVMRINSLRDLLHDLSALGDQLGRLPSSAIKRFVRLGGQVSKYLGR